MSRSFDPNSLIPETPILVYPSLAATIGLEEATMLSLLTGHARQQQGLGSNGYVWYVLNESAVSRLMPFWQPQDIQRIAANLREQGLVLIASAPYTTARLLKFAFNDKVAQPAAAQAAVAQTAAPTNQGKNLIASGWQPDRETLGRLAQHNIPGSFALEQVPEFVNYWRERGESAHSWGSKFIQHTIRKWREYESSQNSQTLMTRSWRPSEEALDVLTRHAGISRQFVEDAIPEFELYWREKGVRSDNWNKKFRDHVHHQWLRYKAALEHDPTPRRIAANWSPSQDVYEVLRLANIDITFAQTLLPEFVIYWRDSNQVHASWNTRFLQYVKQRWARRLTEDDPQTKSTREMSLAEQLTDRSWAL